MKHDISNGKQSPATKITNRNTDAEAEALFLSIGEGAIVVNSEGKLSRINYVAEKILNLKAENVIGKWYPDVVIAEDENGKVIPNIERPITEVFLTGKPVFRRIYVRKSETKRIALAMTVSPVLDNGKPIGAIEVFRDISDEVRLEKAKNEFIAIASHQLRTPATAVKQYINMLLDGYAGALNEAQERFLITANNGNNRQLRIIDDILKVAAADSGDMVLVKEKVELIELIQGVVDEQAPKLEKSRQQYSFTHPSMKVYSLVDKDVFRMVIENLLDNAHKYTYPGKSIEVSIEKTNTDIIISVKDEGVGIKKSDLNKLFQKFVRLDSSLTVKAGGTGLGLYWVKQVLLLHEAKIVVKSKPNHGSVFQINVPVSVE